MAPAASTTVVCPYRPAHSALAVRHVHVTPAAEHARDQQPVAPTATARAAAKRGADRALNTASPRRAMGGRARYTHAVHARAHRRTKRHEHARARVRACVCSSIGRHTGARDRTNHCAHSSCPRDIHAIHEINSVGGCMYMCCDRGRAARANGLKCVRGFSWSAWCEPRWYP
jgi:hypothetical protein